MGHTHALQSQRGPQAACSKQGRPGLSSAHTLQPWPFNLRSFPGESPHFSDTETSRSQEKRAGGT